MSLSKCWCVVAAALLGSWGAARSTEGPGVHLRNVADASGVRFVHHASATPGHYFVESAPGGLAIFDYNDDGRPDMFFTNGAATPSLEKTSAMYANRLYRNDGHMRFTDVTCKRVGLVAPLHERRAEIQEQSGIVGDG